MRKSKIFLIAIIVFVIASLLGAGIILNGTTILRKFKITSVTNKYNQYTVTFDKVKAAEYYKIEIVDANDIKVYDENTTDTTNILSLTNLEAKMKYRLNVTAFDKDGNKREAVKKYEFVYNLPSFNVDNSLLLNNEDYLLKIDGDLETKNYIIKIQDGDIVLKEERLLTNEYTISKELFENKSICLRASIYEDDVLIDEIELYNNLNPLTDINISIPKNESIIPYGDISVVFAGGDHAESYELAIYEGKNLLKKVNVGKKQCILSKNIFAVAKSYRIVITATLGPYQTSSEIAFTMSEQEKLKPVGISNDWKHLKAGSQITLESANPGAKIYYTLDGKSPESFGQLYDGPITIDEDTILKTVAVQDDKQSSVISTYDIKVLNRDRLKVYISPSNQYGNIGVHEVGYTNERDEMNDLANYIVERLEQNGVKVYRNYSSGDINSWLKDSNYLGVDLHIAIHSNASTNHDKYGIETWIHSEESPTYSLASQIQNNLMSIYPYRELSEANRGVKYAEGALGEVNDNYLPFGILVEVAHHDYKDDALWIMQNKQLIGYNIADSILKYYQIID